MKRSTIVTLLVCAALAASPVLADSVNGAWGHLVFKEGEDLWPVGAVHMVHLHTGDILMFNKTYDLNSNQPISAWVLRLAPDEAFPDPETTPAEGFEQYFIAVDDTDVNLFCGGHTQLADGRVLVAGGQGPAGLNDGITSTRILDPVTLTWETVGDMVLERWYPTLTTLDDGRVLANSGIVDLPGQTPVWEIVQPNEIFDPATGQWTLMPPSADFAAFPYTYNFLTPEGDVVTVGPQTSTMELDLGLEQWFNLGNSPFSGSTGSAVLFDEGLILKAGSQNNGNGEDKAAVFNTATDTWASINGGMVESRRRHDIVVLPDGTSLIVGGQTKRVGGNEGDPSFAVYEPELFVPGTDPLTDPGSFTLLDASMDAPRMYHSSSTLLRDGRVLVGGGEPLNGSLNTISGQLYSPPYLFTGTPRPVIDAAPNGAAWNKLITVGTPDAASVESASLVRLGAATHGFDQDQRHIALDIEDVLVNGLKVRTPQNRRVAPPGYYMLFLISDQGVPSVAEYIRLRNDPTPPPPPPPKWDPHMQ